MKIGRLKLSEVATENKSYRKQYSLPTQLEKMLGKRGITINVHSTLRPFEIKHVKRLRTPRDFQKHDQCKIVWGADPQKINHNFSRGPLEITTDYLKGSYKGN